MKRKSVFLGMLVLYMIGIVLNGHALCKECGEKNKKVHEACMSTKYKDLPTPVKNLMKKLNCDVKTGSVYDYGYALDLNDDSIDEYAFCCYESGHGPCEMKIFGNVAGKWTTILEFMPGFTDDKTPCFGFVVLRTKTEGYYDICLDDGEVIKFKGGMYKRKGDGKDLAPIP
ncbi:MAG: hypothetical protein PHT49_05425 [Desulfovibrionales bacterium]|nr:hypothetical protein [Desulfovibrionales bacterium]